MDSAQTAPRDREGNAAIRQATVQDASRIAEIAIFAKRVNYRSIFHNDRVSFGEMQVYPLARAYVDHPESLCGIWVYEDEFVKGFIRLDGTQIAELYVDSFFANRGIGGRLIRFAIENHQSDRLWVLEKNVKARRFYERHGFMPTGNRKPEDGTAEYIIELRR